MTHHGEPLDRGYPLVDGVVVEQPLQDESLLPRPDLHLAVEDQWIGFVVPEQRVGSWHPQIGDAHRTGDWGLPRGITYRGLPRGFNGGWAHPRVT